MLIKSDQGKITRFSQQNAPALPHPEVPLQMDDEMLAVFDGATRPAIPSRCPMSTSRAGRTCLLGDP